MSDNVVEVIIPPEVMVQVDTDDPTLVEVVSVPIAVVIEVGLSGPQGISGPTAFSGSTPYYTQTISVPSSDWVIPHALGYVPNITVLIGGQQVMAEVYSTTSSSTIHFNTPQVGQVVAS